MVWETGTEDDEPVRPGQPHSCGGGGGGGGGGGVGGGGVRAL